MGPGAEARGNDAPLRGRAPAGHRWWVNGQGQTFAGVEGPVEFRMGSPPDEPGRDPDEPAHRRRIPRRFAIAVREVTVAQFQEFLRQDPEVERSPDQPVQPRPGRADEPDDLVPGGGLLQLAEPASGPARSATSGIRRDDMPRDGGPPRDAARGLPPAHRGGMGIRLPGGGRDRPGPMDSPSACCPDTPGTRATAGTGPGRSGACCPTTWASSTCWATPWSGARMPPITIRTRPRGRRPLPGCLPDPG